MGKEGSPLEGESSPITGSPASLPPPGTRTAPPAPAGGGAAPWERAGAAPAPGTAASAEATEKYRRLEASAAAAAAAAAEAAAADRAAAAVEAERARQAELERTARVMFWVGAAGVPLMFPVAAMYFWSEARDPTASKVIRGYIFKGAALFVIYTVVLIAWFTTFQVLKNGALSGFSVLDENKTTSVLSTLAN